MKATARHVQPVKPVEPVDAGQVPFASSLVLSIFLHSALVLWLIGSAWLLSHSSYRLASQTVYLGGDSPLVIDQLPGEGGGAKPAPKAAEPAEAETGAAPSVDKLALPVEKPTPPPPKPAVAKPPEALPPKPVVEKAAPPP